MSYSFFIFLEGFLYYLLIIIDYSYKYFLFIVLCVLCGLLLLIFIDLIIVEYKYVGMNIYKYIAKRWVFLYKWELKGFI